MSSALLIFFLFQTIINVLSLLRDFILELKIHRNAASCYYRLLADVVLQQIGYLLLLQIAMAPPLFRNTRNHCLFWSFYDLDIILIDLFLIKLVLVISIFKLHIRESQHFQCFQFSKKKIKFFSFFQFFLWYFDIRNWDQSTRKQFIDRSEFWGLIRSLLGDIVVIIENLPKLTELHIR